MKIDQNIWNQLKSLTGKDFYRALLKDPHWEFVNTIGAQQTFRHKLTGKTVSIHYHPTKKCGYGPNLLKDLLVARRIWTMVCKAQYD